jgi:protein-S-isoprenylcysteine O-methyltransferase Ste14
MQLNPELKKGIISWGIKGVLYKAYVAAVLMISAGRWNWVPGWIYIVVFLSFDAATALVAIPRSPELLIERSRSQPNVKAWDKRIMPLAAGILPLFSWIIAGLNERWSWKPDLGIGVSLIGLLLTILGHAIIVWAIGANAFFSPVMRIQIERGHTVEMEGPYQFIRHPGYFGAILFTIGIPLLLGSLWAVFPSLIAVILYILRTKLEDQTLQAELTGYKEYTQRVEYKLIPGVW